MDSGSINFRTLIPFEFCRDLICLIIETRLENECEREREMCTARNKCFGTSSFIWPLVWILVNPQNQVTKQTNEKLQQAKDCMTIAQNIFTMYFRPFIFVNINGLGFE